MASMLVSGATGPVQGRAADGKQLSDLRLD
jgi:hypothetical protein